MNLTRFGASLVYVANAGLLSIPMLWTRGHVVGSSPFWLFMLGATLLCRADLQRHHDVGSVDRMPTTWPSRAVCSLTGVGILVCWWVALSGRIEFGSQFVALRVLVGFALMLFGSEVRRRAVAVLGERFVSDVRPWDSGAPKLQTDDVYRWVRHPSESGLHCCVAGGCVLLGSLTGLCVWACVLLPLSLIRIRMEEVGMLETFGVEYSNYRRAVGAILPGCGSNGSSGAT